MSNNTEQKELWNGSLGEGFISFEDYIHKVVEPISRVAIASVGAKTGDCILDVGCGGGFTSVSFSATGASVTGVDISDKMIDQAKSKAQSIPNVSFVVADAATEVFEKKFNHVFSHFGVMFFADPKSAFRNLRSGLTDGGKLTFVCWQDPSLNEWINISAQAVKSFQPVDAPPPDPRSPGGFAFADKDYIREILEDADFSNIQIQPINKIVDMGESIEEIVHFHTKVGPLSHLLEGLDEDEQKVKAIEAVRLSVKHRMTESGLLLSAAVWLVTADG